MTLFHFSPWPFSTLGILVLFASGLVAPLQAQDDHGNTAATATNVALNSTTNGVFNSPTDVDYFRITLTQDAHVAFFTTGTTDTLGSLRNSTDQEIFANDDGTDLNFRIEADLTAGTYYLRVSSFDGATGSYSLRVEASQFGVDDHGNTAATATVVSLNTPTAGLLNSVADVDYFRFSVAAAARITATTTGTTDTIGSLRNSTDQEIAGNDDGLLDRNFQIERDLVAGTYYIRVTGALGASGPYSLRVETASSGGTTTVSTAVPANVTATSATFGGTVTSAASSNITQRGVVYGTTPTPILANPAFTTLSSGSGTGTFSAQSGTLLANTRYYVRAFAVTTTGTVYGNQLEFATTAAASTDDHGNTIATATSVAASSSTNGVLNSSSDLDYFRIVVAVTSQIVVSSTGSTDVLASLRNASDQEIASDDNSNGGVNFRITQTLGAGTYYVRVTSRTSATGAYILTVQTTSNAPPGVTTATPSGITAFAAVLGGEVTNAGSFAVTQRGIVYGTSTKPVIDDPAFVVLPGGSGAGTFTVSSPTLIPKTRYFVRAFAVNAIGVGYGENLEFTTEDDDFGNSTATAATIVPNSATSGVINSATDVDFFRFILAGDARVAIFTRGSIDTVGSLRSSSDQEIAREDGGGEGLNFRIERSLAAGTYYIRVSSNNGATGSYSLRLEASTAPVVSTALPTAVTSVEAELGGTVSSDGGAPVTQRGVVIGLNANPALPGERVLASSSGGTGSFTETVNLLLPETEYHVRAFAVNAAGTAYGEDVTFSTAPGSRIVNLSIRSQAGDGAASLIVGFSLSGPSNKTLLLRVVGPGLAQFGVTGALDDPFLQLSSPQSAIASNENWDGSAAVVNATASVGAFPLSSGSRDSVLLQSLPSNNYTIRAGGGAGIALVELYDTAPNLLPKLTNVSTRAPVGTGGNILIAGFTVTGPLTKTVLIRAIGPTLATFQVTGVLADPQLAVYRGGSTVLASNDNWGGVAAAALSAAFDQVGAFALPTASRDAATLVTLPAGSYTVQVSGVGGGTGIALLEIYEVP
jgi:hypothetical protein